MSTSRSGSLVDSPQVRGFSVSSRNALLLSGLLSVDRIAKRRFAFLPCSLFSPNLHAFTGRKQSQTER